MWAPDPDALRGRTALVAVATRGAGRGIAAALGEAGATVICTGQHRRGQRAVRLRPPRDDRGHGRPRHRPGRHGRGAAGRSPRPGAGAAVGQPNPGGARRHRRAGQRHLGAKLLKGGPASWDTPIWRHDLDDGLRILRLAVDTHLITSHHVLPLLIERPGGLLVEVTDGTTPAGSGPR